MADIQIDINELLEDYATENAKATRRALVAEAQVKAQQKIIDNLATTVGELREKYEPEALAADIERLGLTVVDGEAAEPETKPAAKKAAKPAAAKKTASPRAGRRAKSE